ncbi:hypothetical protein Pan258_53990 [Symmachiella dynata]|uniref:hypothetical protein n=1 Tax=Symmachiella dynata TaxID=2527995 RepID=UPI0011892063|nr:hypothetical protein [Symmachiella dynata]QDT51310.1 hypothetical protein Pan258_53990 [Symmachiella dynata]
MIIPISCTPRFTAPLVFVVMLLHVSMQLQAKEVVVDQDRGFALTLPDGFVVSPEIVNTNPRIIHSFVLGDPNDDVLDIFLLIENMGATIGREPLKPENMPPGFQGRLFSMTWQGYKVDAFEVPERLGEISVMTYNVQIPLKRGAIQVKLFGEVGREQVLKRLLSEVLDGLTGESNWIPSASPDTPITSSKNYGTTLLVIAAVIILGGLFTLFLISKKSPKGTVLAIAAAIYGVSWIIDGIRVREVILLAGALRMLGFAGGILGIVELVRKRKPRDEVSK